jgi:O-antigen ligase/polysaccharide polymerase Wzy-like membrane protein
MPLVLGSKQLAPVSAALRISDHQRRRVAAAALTVGLVLTVFLALAGATAGAIAVPLSLGALVALAVVPFPAADRWLALGLIGSFPLVPPLGLPNVPLAAGVIGVALLRIGLIGWRTSLPRPAIVMLAVLWGALAVGLALSSWPPISIWLRPLALVAIGAAASVLGVLVWSDPDRRDRWLDGLGVGVVIVSITAAAVFFLQHFASVIDVRDGVVGLMGFFRGELAAQKFADQNNWIIFGDELTLRAVSPLFPAPNNVGGYLGVTLPLVVARWFLAPPGRWRALAGAAAVLSVLTLVLTISRSSWVAASVATATVVLIVVARHDLRQRILVGESDRVRRAVALTAIVIAIGALGIVSVGQRGIEDRLVHPLEDPSVQERFDLGEAAIEAMRADMIRGVGLGNWTATIPEGEYIHNVYLEYGVAVGLFGAAWALMLVAIPFVAGAIGVARRSTAAVQILGLGVMAGAAFNGTQFMFDDNLLVPQYAWLTFWAIGGSLALVTSTGTRSGDPPDTSAT